MIFNFNSGITYAIGDESPFTKLTTVQSVVGGALPTINGTGYINIKRVTGSNTVDELYVYIDGASTAFPISSTKQTGIAGGYYKFYFQKFIRFGNGASNDSYSYQTLLSDKPIADKYTITQGGIYQETGHITFNGKGKVLLSVGSSSVNYYYSVDGGSETGVTFAGGQYMEYMFNESFKIRKDTSTIALYYIVYLEKE